MFFLLRCAFWLGIVFYMMDWPGGATPAATASAALGEAAHAAAGAAVARVVPAVGDLCLAKPAACLALVAGAPPVSTPSPAGSARLTAPPLPPRRPHAIVGNG